MSKKKSSITLTEETRKALEKLKIHPRESYEELIKRIIKEGRKNEI